MNNFVIVQVLGVLTLIIFVVSMQQKEKERFLLMQTAGTMIFIIQYLLTARYTGAITFTIVLIRGLVFFVYKRRDMKPSLVVMLVFQSALLISGCLTWQNMFSVIPMIATVIKTWSTWQDDMKWTRRTSLLSQSIMIVYNLTAMMYTGALTEMCNLVSTVIAIRRFDRNMDILGQS